MRRLGHPLLWGLIAATSLVAWAALLGARGMPGDWLSEWGSGLRLGGLSAANLWVAGVLLGLAIVVWNRRRLLPLVVWGAASVVGYSLLGVPAYPWYGVPVHFLLAVAFAVGLGTILDGLGRRAPRPVATGLASVVLALVLIQLGAPVARSLASPGVTERHLAYRRLASWLADHAGPDASVAYHESVVLGGYEGRTLTVFARLGGRRPSSPAGADRAGRSAR
jgi:hypothetical protein